ncbi:MAG: glycosyl hydrolase, partial [Bacteroidota bacterium]
AAKEAERLGLSFGVHNCDGWSSSGGPWVTPEISMKMVVWSETVVSGGEVNVQLEKPTARHDYYEDITVIAYPALASDREDHSLRPTLSASDPDFDLALAADGKTDAMDHLGPDANGETWLQFTYAEPRTLRSAEAVFTDRHATVELLASDDGRQFRKVQDIYKVRTAKSEWAVNDHFPAVTARHFRLRFNQGITLKEATLSSTYRLHNRMGRTALGRTEDRRLTPIGDPAPEMIVNSWEIRDLTNKMTDDGLLIAELPAIEWTILRFGQTTTGATNHPASAEGKGLEVDKLSREAFKVHYDAFVGEVVARNESVAPNALQYAEIDSYEMGGQNWTDGFAESFAEAKGYNIMEFLPLLAGRFVDNTATSEEVLRDFRGHICDLMTENYFTYFTELC